MSTENTIVEPIEDDVNLDDFAAELFGQSEAPADKAKSEAADDDPGESDASLKDTHSNVPDPDPDNDDDEDGTDVDEADTLASDNEDDDTSETDESDGDEPKAQPKKKNRFQERIDEVVGKQREAERKLEAALAELAAIKQKTTEKPEPAPVKEASEDKAPQPTDLKEDGTEKYPLGEFDPNYIKDLTKYTLASERKVYEDQQREEAIRRQIDEEQAQLNAKWQEQRVSAQERYPDFQEKGQQLLGTFEGIDAAYGEYLTTTLMSMDHGADVLYYLANNVDEAQKIVNSGPQRATIALGRLEAQFAVDAEEKPSTSRPKVSKAPAPPPQNKGTALAKPAVRGDEDDLEAVAAALFGKKK